jgi:hypothetical protein
MNPQKRLSIAIMAGLYISILALSGLFSSCKKGDTGPPGPVGVQGDSGINGSANIITSIYTITTTVAGGDTSSTWVSTNTPTYRWVANFADTFITLSTNDVVLAYWSLSYGSAWNALPVSLINQGDAMNYRYTNDSISFTYYTGGAPYTKYPGYPAISPGYATILFKVIVIPPGLEVNYPGVNWKNAAEVATLPEVKAALNKR